MSALPFEISNLRRHDGPTLVAFFDVTLPGVIVRDCRYHIVKRVSFVAGPTIRSQYAIGGYAKHAEFDDDLAIEIRDAVEARLAADEACEA